MNGSILSLGPMGVLVRKAMDVASLSVSQHWCRPWPCFSHWCCTCGCGSSLELDGSVVLVWEGAAGGVQLCV
jgi:hypothetical protein